MWDDLFPSRHAYLFPPKQIVLELDQIYLPVHTPPGQTLTVLQTQISTRNRKIMQLSEVKMTGRVESTNLSKTVEFTAGLII